jgi:hypothetical protein
MISIAALFFRHALVAADLPPRLAAQIQVVLESAIILSVTITVAGVLGSLVAAASERRALAVGVTGLFRTAVRSPFSSSAASSC